MNSAAIRAAISTMRQTANELLTAAAILQNSIERTEKHEGLENVIDGDCGR